MKILAFCSTVAGASIACLLLGGCATPRINATPMKTGVRRLGAVAVVRPGMLDRCRELYSKPPRDVIDAMKSARLRNYSVYLEKADPIILFNYFEYSGGNYQADMARLATDRRYAEWHKECNACLLSAGGTQNPAWIEGEPVFFTAGSANVVPTPAKYTRTGMITGLKPEKEAEYRTLHATAWPGVLKGIADCNLRNFSIYLCPFNGKLYLLGYLEYVGTDPVADGAKGKALPVNKRWWKYTDACQQPLPDAAAKHEIWSGMQELWHLN